MLFDEFKFAHPIEEPTATLFAITSTQLMASFTTIPPKNFTEYVFEPPKNDVELVELINIETPKTSKFERIDAAPRAISVDWAFKLPAQFSEPF